MCDRQMIESRERREEREPCRDDAVARFVGGKETYLPNAPPSGGGGGSPTPSLRRPADFPRTEQNDRQIGSTRPPAAIEPPLRRGVLAAGSHLSLPPPLPTVSTRSAPAGNTSLTPPGLPRDGCCEISFLRGNEIIAGLSLTSAGI